MKFLKSVLLVKFIVLSAWSCNREELRSFALSPCHSTIISNRHHRFRCELLPGQVRIGIKKSLPSTKLEYRSDTDLPEQESTVSPILPPTTEERSNDIPDNKHNDDDDDNNNNNASQKHSKTRKSLKQQNRDRSRPPLRRSFLHELDRFLTKLQGTDNHLQKNTFLTGNFAPVLKEHVSVPVQLVEGCVPLNLNGAFCRNGPNPIRELQKKRYHWFDGHAMLHTLMFSNGEVPRYTNQFIPSPRFSIEQELGEEYFPTIGEYKGMLGLMKLTFHPQLVKEKIKDLKTVAPPNTNIMMYNKKLFCLHEASLPMECRMHPDGRLEYVGYETFDNVLDYPVSAHPVRDGNDLLFHSYSVDEELIKEHGTMKVGRYNSKTASVDTYLVPTPTKNHVSFAHSLIHTNNYIVVWDCSVHFRTDALFMGGSFFKNNQDFTLKFGLIPKNANSREDVIWIDSGEVGAIVHPLHAWEEVEEDNVVIKLWTPFCRDLELNLEKSSVFHMTEFIIDLNFRSVIKNVIDDTINSEFATMPQIPSQSSSCIESSMECGLMANAQKNSLSTHERYGFTAIFGDGGSFIGWAKWDLKSRRLHSTVYYGPHESGGEPIVMWAKNQLAADGAPGEVDNPDEHIIYIGSYVYNENENQSYFLLFDGKTNSLVCRLKMPQRVPFGFHGHFISREELDKHYQYHQEYEKRANHNCPIQWVRFFIQDFITDFTHQLGFANSPSPHLTTIMEDERIKSKDMNSN